MTTPVPDTAVAPVMALFARPSFGTVVPGALLAAVVNATWLHFYGAQLSLWLAVPIGVAIFVSILVLVHFAVATRSRRRQTSG